VQDCICALYEASLVPVREIARLSGMTERSVYAIVRRRGCRPRMRLACGGGRRIVPLSQAPTARRGRAGLDAAGVARAAQATEEAAEKIAAATLFALEEAARRKAEREEERAGAARDAARLSAWTGLNRALEQMRKLSEERAKRPLAQRQVSATQGEASTGDALERGLWSTAEAWMLVLDRQREDDLAAMQRESMPER